MDDIKDGLYRTCPMPGPGLPVRCVTIKKGFVHLEDSKFVFTAPDFFKVNKLLGPVVDIEDQRTPEASGPQ